MKRMMILILVVLIALSAVLPVTSSAQIAESVAATAAADYPAIVSITTGATGFTIKWSAYEGAAKYRVFYHNGTKWKTIADTASTTYAYNGLTDGVEYTLTVRALDEKGEFMSKYNTSGWKRTFYAAPKLISAEVVDGTVEIKWNKISTDDCIYRVYKRSGSAWTGIGSTTEDTYVDTNVEKGNTYYYTVRAFSYDMKDMLSSYDSKGIFAAYAVIPKITKTESRSNAVRITWDGYEGAYACRLFYHNGTKWKKIADVKGTAYDHVMTATGVELRYTVRAIDSAGNFISDYDREGWIHKYLPAPKLISADNTYTGQKITWEPVENADGYRVYYKTDGSWIFLGNSSTDSYLAEGLENGVTYTYTVRCISEDGRFLHSYFDRTGKTKKYVEAPVVSSIENVASGPLLTWQEIEGVENFRVFCHNGTKWKKIADVNSSSYCHIDAAEGVTYVYTVRAIDSKGNFISGYNTNGYIHTFYKAPEFSSVEPHYSRTRLEWEPRDNAAAYRVYRRGMTGKWKWLSDCTDTFYTDYTAPVDAPYQYTLRVLDVDGNTVSPYLDNNPYYYMGELADGVITVDGESYRFSEGKRVKDYVTAQDIIDIAEAEVGYAAEYLKKCKYNTWFYGYEVSGYGYDWCAVFVNWVFNEAGAAELLYGQYANCGAMGLMFSENGRLVTSDYQVGDVVFFNWDDSYSTYVPGMKSLDHVGIIKEVHGDGSYTTIEGNTGVTRDGEVLIQTRYEDNISCAGRPEYGKKLNGTLPMASVSASALDAELKNAPAGGERPRP